MGTSKFVLLRVVWCIEIIILQNWLSWKPTSILYNILDLEKWHQRILTTSRLIFRPKRVHAIILWVRDSTHQRFPIFSRLQKSVKIRQRSRGLRIFLYFSNFYVVFHASCVSPLRFVDPRLLCCSHLGTVTRLWCARSYCSHLGTLIIQLQLGSNCSSKICITTLALAQYNIQELGRKIP